MSIANKLENIYNSLENVREAMQELDPDIARKDVDTLADDIRTLFSAKRGFGVDVYKDVVPEESEEPGEPVEPGGIEQFVDASEEQEEDTKINIFSSVLGVSDIPFDTDVLDGIGELSGDMVTLDNGYVQVPLGPNAIITVDPERVEVKFKDPLVQSIVISNWGQNDKINLKQVRAITNLGSNFHNTAIETFNEFKWFDGLTSTGREYYFENCSSLKEITLPRAISLAQSPFVGCTSLEKLTLPDTLLNLGQDYTYSRGYIDGTKIEEIVIPSSVTKTNSQCFIDAPYLKKIVWGDNLPFPRQDSSNTDYKTASFGNCPNLETIENLPNVFQANVPTHFKGDVKLDFTEIYPKLVPVINNTWLGGNNSYFDETNFFDYAPNGIAEFTGITGTETEVTTNRMFQSNSEAGFTAKFPNWINYPCFRYFNGVGRIELSENTVSLEQTFAYSCDATEYLLPCTTPPSLSEYNELGKFVRIFVPEQAMSAYLADDIWSQHASHLRPIPDLSSVEFCTIPDIAPVPIDYTRVEYIRNYDDNGLINCFIGNIGYQLKQHSQILLDFSHERYASAEQDSECLFNSGLGNKDFYITIHSNDVYPAIYRFISNSNTVGLTLDQKWYFNSNVTGEEFGKRSTLKFSNKYVEYHGLVKKVDETTADSSDNISFLKYNDNYGLRGRKVHIYRLCIFEPIENCNDYNDPTQYQLVRDYIPVMRNSDGKFGLYERIVESGTFYSSTKSGAEFVGPKHE